MSFDRHGHSQKRIEKVGLAPTKEPSKFPFLLRRPYYSTSVYNLDIVTFLGKSQQFGFFMDYTVKKTSKRETFYRSLLSLIHGYKYFYLLVFFFIHNFLCVIVYGYAHLNRMDDKRKTGEAIEIV